MQRADGIDYETFLLLKMLDFLSVFGGICFSLGMYYLKKKKETYRSFQKAKLGVKGQNLQKSKFPNSIFFRLRIM